MNQHVRVAHRDRVSVRSAFIRAKKLSQRYAARLRGIAKTIDHIIRGFDATTLHGQTLIQASLLRYREVLTPWAEATADTFVKEVAAADQQGWRRMSAEIGRGIEREIQSAPVAPVMVQMKQDQVRLIRSLPEEAAERVNRLVTEGISKGVRAETIAKDIYETGSVTRARADLIARTETGRVATTLTMARAQHVRSPGYFWETSRDGDVRPSHKAMQGKFVAWDAPPTLDNMQGHAGALPNCRCFCRVSLPE